MNYSNIFKKGKFTANMLKKTPQTMKPDIAQYQELESAQRC